MFNDIIVKNFSNPEFAAEFENATNTIELGNPVCGDRIKVQLHIEDGVIKKANYAAWGCATSLATGNVFCSHINGAACSDIQSMDKEHIENMLGELDPSQHHCLEMLHKLFEKLQHTIAVQ